MTEEIAIYTAGSYDAHDHEYAWPPHAGADHPLTPTRWPPTLTERLEALEREVADLRSRVMRLEAPDELAD